MACPICKKPTSAEFRPFCSKRCADVDLGKWLKGDYAIPAPDLEDPEEREIAMQDTRPAKPH